MYALVVYPAIRALEMIDLNRSSDSEMLQFVFFWEKVSVAARKREISWRGFEVFEDDAAEDDLDIASTPDVEDGMAFAS